MLLVRKNNIFISDCLFSRLLNGAFNFLPILMCIADDTKWLFFRIGIQFFSVRERADGHIALFCGLLKR